MDGRSRVSYLTNDNGELVGVQDFATASGGGGSASPITRPTAMSQSSTFVWTTPGSYWGTSCIISLDGQIMTLGVDYTISPGAAAFAVQTITTSLDWTGRTVLVTGNQ